MSEEQIKYWLVLWGAGLSTVLGVIKLWEVLWRDRIRLSTTYSFTGAHQENDEITVVNLSNQTVQIQHWSLAWQPAFWNRGNITDLTPYDGGSRFSIEPRSEHTIVFSEEDKFDWSWKAAKGRRMYLSLFLFGRKRPIKLLIKA